MKLVIFVIERAVEARERFSLDRIAGMWEELFEGMLHG